MSNTSWPSNRANALRAAALAAWRLSDPQTKCQAVHALWARAGCASSFGGDGGAPPLPGVGEAPGRPDRPQLVSPRRVPQRSLSTPEGRAALVHAVAHIEFNAINLALDAAWRFAAMPEAYLLDWLRVADEEATHFELVRAHLLTLGFDYGAFDAHAGLWDLADKTAHDVLARMALLPRTMEARGLDVNPGMRARLVQAGDLAAGPVLDRILADEIGHVAVGNRWFHWLCAQRGLDPVAVERAARLAHGAPQPRPPINWAARRAAGFTEAELATLREQVEPVAGSITA